MQLKVLATSLVLALDLVRSEVDVNGFVEQVMGAARDSLSLSKTLIAMLAIFQALLHAFQD